MAVCIQNRWSFALSVRSYDVAVWRRETRVRSNAVSGWVTGGGDDGGRGGDRAACCITKIDRGSFSLLIMTTADRSRTGD